MSVILFFITSVFNPAFAQTKNQTGNIDKFEIAVDLQEFFSEGYPNKVLFKISIKDNIDYPNVDEFYTLFVVPFAEVKVFLSSNLSVAFEGGLMNSFNWSKSEGGDVNPDNRQYHSFYRSRLELPYSLTFNFNF